MRESKRVDPVLPLLPCPFDGGPPILDFEIDKDAAHEDEIGMIDAHVWCHECGARGPRCDGYAFDESDMKVINRETCAAWNKAPRSAGSASGD